MLKHTLHLCYFGLREPLVQTQVLPYLREIKRLGNLKISLLTFETSSKETWTAEQIHNEKNKLASEGIEWNFLTYHKTPSAPATIYDVLCGAYFVWKIMRREQVDVLHARIHVPAMMAALARKFSRQKSKLLFDIRGFFPEEYTDAGRWKENGLIYKSVKLAEKWLLKQSDAFVVLTKKAQGILFLESADSGFDRAGRPVEVIPCCVNLKNFDIDYRVQREEIRKRLEIENRRVIIYVGSLGTWYMAKEMAHLTATAIKNDSSTFAIFLTQSDPNIIKQELLSNRIGEENFLVTKVSHTEIPAYLCAADVAISFIKPCYSKLSSSPTKIAEYLASGLPIITNRGVGDVAEMVEENNVGAVVDNFDEASYLKALEEINQLRRESDLAEKCRSAAKHEFDLAEIGGTKYRSIYKKMLDQKA